MRADDGFHEKMEAIAWRAGAVDRLACELASKGQKAWRMCIPPSAEDSDILMVQVARHDVPTLLRALTAALEGDTAHARKLIAGMQCPVVRQYSSARDPLDVTLDLEIRDGLVAYEGERP